MLDLPQAAQKNLAHVNSLGEQIHGKVLIGGMDAGIRKAHAQHQGIRSQHALHFFNDRDAAPFPYQHGFVAKSLFQRLLGGKTELGIRISHVSIPAMAPPEFHRDALGGMFLYMFFQQGFNPFRLLSRHQAA